MFWSSPAGSSVFLLLPACYSWSVHWMKADINSSLKSPGWFYSILSCDRRANQLSWCVVAHRMAWSSSVVRPWRKTSVRRLCVVTMLVPVSMAWTQSWRSQFLTFKLFEKVFILCTDVPPCETVRCLEWLMNNLMTHQNVDLMKELGYVAQMGHCFTAQYKKNKVSPHWTLTEPRWWSSLSSPQTCLSCRWRWMYTPLWKRYTEKWPRRTRRVTGPVSNNCFRFVSRCSGCFCSSIPCGTAPSSSSWLTLMPGCASAGQVQWGQIRGNTLNLYFITLV